MHICLKHCQKLKHYELKKQIYKHDLKYQFNKKKKQTEGDNNNKQKQTHEKQFQQGLLSNSSPLNKIMQIAKVVQACYDTNSCIQC